MKKGCCSASFADKRVGRGAAASESGEPERPDAKEAADAWEPSRVVGDHGADEASEAREPRDEDPRSG